MTKVDFHDGQDMTLLAILSYGTPISPSTGLDGRLMGEDGRCVAEMQPYAGENESHHPGRSFPFWSAMQLGH